MKQIFIIALALGITACGSEPKEVDPLAKAYAQCYAEMTSWHKASGLHDRNREHSIRIKEQTCKAKVLVK